MERVVHVVGLGWSCVRFLGITCGYLGFLWEAGRLTWVTVLPVIGWVAWLVDRGCGAGTG